jgi:hypothetical protein
LSVLTAKEAFELELELEALPVLLGDSLVEHCATAPTSPLGGGGHMSVEGHSPDDLTKFPLVHRIFPSCAEVLVMVPKPYTLKVTKRAAQIEIISKKPLTLPSDNKLIIQLQNINIQVTNGFLKVRYA